MKGNFELVNKGRVVGWCIDANSGEAQSVRVFVDDTYVGEGLGNKFRLDLAKKQIRDGYAEFQINIPDEYMDGREHDVRVTFSDGTELAGSPKRVRLEDLKVNAIDWREQFESKIICETDVEYDAVEGVRNLIQTGAVKDVAILCGFEPDGKVRAYHRYYAQKLKQAGFFVIHVNTSAGHWLDGEVNEKADVYLRKQNFGYDFGSWLAVISLLLPQIGKLKRLLLCNDSLFAPLFDIKNVLKAQTAQKADFFGLADSFEHTYHIQSYFLVLSGKALNSEVFDQFASQYEITSDKQRIVETGEFGITRVFSDAGVKTGSLVKFDEVRSKWLQNAHSYYKDIQHLDLKGGRVQRFEEIHEHVLSGRPLNQTHFFWRTLFEDFQFPVLKRDLIYKNNVNIPDWFMIPSVLSRTSKYPLEHLHQDRYRETDLVPLVSDVFEPISET